MPHHDDDVAELEVAGSGCRVQGEVRPQLRHVAVVPAYQSDQRSADDSGQYTCSAAHPNGGESCVRVCGANAAEKKNENMYLKDN